MGSSGGVSSMRKLPRLPECLRSTGRRSRPALPGLVAAEAHKAFKKCGLSTDEQSKHDYRAYPLVERAASGLIPRLPRRDLYSCAGVHGPCSGNPRSGCRRFYRGLAADQGSRRGAICGNPRAHRSAPLLLWLHGGPGGPERPLFRYFNRDLERPFLVAYLDQRGAGRFFDRAADPARLTVEQHLEDLETVVSDLSRAYAKEKIYLLGHSWGSVLGLLHAKAHPETWRR
jgi:hypothetical protein